VPRLEVPAARRPEHDLAAAAAHALLEELVRVAREVGGVRDLEACAERHGGDEQREGERAPQEGTPGDEEEQAERGTAPGHGASSRRSTTPQTVSTVMCPKS